MILTPNGDSLVPRHDWKSRLYVGILKIETSQTGPTWFRSGSIPVVRDAFGVLRRQQPTRTGTRPSDIKTIPTDPCGVERPTVLR